MEVSRYDFSECLFDISAVPEGTALLDYYPELADHPEFNSKNTEREQKITICLCDFKSPFVRMDISVKIDKIFEYLGIGLKAKATRELYEQVKKFNNKLINEMITKYLMMQANHEFTLWFSNYMAFYQLMEEHRRPVDYSKSDVNNVITRKRMISKEAANMKSELVEQEAFLFNDDRMRQSVATVMIKKQRTYAEMFASDNSVI
jgi:hypothetical protein